MGKVGCVCVLVVVVLEESRWVAWAREGAVVLCLCVL